MKIEPTIVARAALSARALGKGARVSSGAAAVDAVALSASARFVNELRDAVENTPGVRADVVEQARADIASGRLGGELDLNLALDSLLAGF
jgi:hypothetical protein